jgi:arsenate reductase
MPDVVFVCEHGGAKSVLAATYFNHLASRRCLPLRALARGVAPDSEIPQAVIEGLAREGLTPCTVAPVALAPEDLVNAGQVVTFDQPQIAARVPSPALVTMWNDLPPVSADFGIARDAIFAKVRKLFDTLDTSATADAT